MKFLPEFLTYQDFADTPVCTDPGLRGYTMTNTELDVNLGVARVTGVCQTGYFGTVVVTPCFTSGPYTVQGCSKVVVCTDPETPGYSMTNTQLDTSQTFNVSGVCADGFRGTVSVVACTTSGPYTVVGCEETVVPVCTDPGQLGYTMTNTQLDTSQTFEVTGVCATNYEGTVIVQVCDTNGPYSVAGCSVAMCTDPETTGYTMANTQLDMVGFEVSGVCAANYVGSVTVTPCFTSGPYTVSGCSPVVCTDPETAGYSMTETELDTSQTFDVSGACAANYEGTVVVESCATLGGGAYTVSGCSPVVCTDPETPGYSMTNTQLDMSETFDVSGVCADGFAGDVTVVACAASGTPYTPSGCTEGNGRR